jgi:hypothetical protein
LPEVQDQVVVGAVGGVPVGDEACCGGHGGGGCGCGDCEMSGVCVCWGLR